MENIMSDYSHMRYIQTHVGEDLDFVKKEYGKDIARYVGDMIKVFVEKYKEEPPHETFYKFKDELSNLEKVISEETGIPSTNLHNVLLSGFDIEGILIQRGKELTELECYAESLINKNLKPKI